MLTFPSKYINSTSSKNIFSANRLVYVQQNRETVPFIAAGLKKKKKIGAFKLFLWLSELDR